MTELGVMFPGQGTQRVGMGRWMERSSAAARAVFDLAEEVLDDDVRRLCFAGPARELTATEHAQVAVFTVNAAAFALLTDLGHRPVVTLGHSVGGLNALVAAGVLDLADGFGLVAARGRLMAAIERPGTMSAIAGLDAEVVAGICGQATQDTGGPVVAGLLNGPENVVVSGDVAAVAAVEELARAEGARRVSRLAVSHAFHSPLMAGAVPAWREVVAATPLRDPDVPVVLDTTGKLAADQDDVRRALVDQFTSPVRWVDAFRTAAEEFGGRFVETGDSKVLVALARSIEPGRPTATLHDPKALATLTIPPERPLVSRARVVRVPAGSRPGRLLEGLAPGQVFSSSEQAYCARRGDLTGWAGRLAAKLAVADLLGVPTGRPLGEVAGSLAEIEILPAGSGPCGGDPACAGSHPPEVVLHGQLARRAAAGTSDQISVSISHTRALAVALAVRIPARTGSQS